MWAFCFLILATSLSPTVQSQAPGAASRPLVLTSQMMTAGIVYRVNGKIVEDSKENSLLTNLEKITETRGLALPAFVIVDFRLPLTEMGKLETALDKVELTKNRRVFVSYFDDGLMNEIH